MKKFKQLFASIALLSTLLLGISDKGAAQGQAPTTTPIALTDGATISVPIPGKQPTYVFTVTLGGNRTLANPTGLVAGQVLEFIIKQNATTGGNTLTFGSQYVGPNGTALLLNSGVSAKTVIECVADTASTLQCFGGGTPSGGSSPTVVSVTTTCTGTVTSGSCPFLVKFSAPVTVAGGVPTLNLNTATPSAASCGNGSGTATLTCSYTVLSGDTASPVATTANALVLNNATIQAAGANATLTGANNVTFTGLTFAPSSTFSVSGGHIIGPSGSAFVPLGVDVVDCTGNTSCLLNLTASDITTAFPGINFVKVQMYGNYPPPSNYTAWVNALTALGIVVEFTDYNGFTNGSSGCFWVAMTGSALTTEVNWYASMAAAFINNPYVWFNTQNEICDGPNAGSSNAEQVAVYNAIRGTGSSTIIGIELMAGWTTGQSYAGYGFLNAASFTSRTNIHWDVHYYSASLGGFQQNCGGLGNGTPSTLAGNEQAIAWEIACAQTFATSANGTIPAIIGEYGDSAGGSTLDTFWVQAVGAVINAASLGVGSSADDYYFPYAQGGAGSTGDQLFNGQPSQTINPPTLANSSLSAYGVQVAAGILAGTGGGGPTTGTTFDPVNTVQASLSSGNLTVTTTTSQVTTPQIYFPSGARTTTGYALGSSNKRFLVFTMLNTTANTQIGIVPSVYSLGGGPIGGEDWPNLNTTGLGWLPYYSAGGGVIYDSDYLGAGGGSLYGQSQTPPSPTTPSTIILAVDFTRNVGYIWTPEGASQGLAWNLVSGDNPLTNTGGAPLSANFGTDTMYLYAGAGESGTVWSIVPNPSDAVSKSLLSAGWSLW